MILHPKALPLLLSLRHVASVKLGLLLVLGEVRLDLGDEELAQRIGASLGPLRRAKAEVQALGVEQFAGTSAREREDLKGLAGDTVAADDNHHGYHGGQHTNGRPLCAPMGVICSRAVAADHGVARQALEINTSAEADPAQTAPHDTRNLPWVGAQAMGRSAGCLRTGVDHDLDPGVADHAHQREVGALDELRLRALNEAWSAALRLQRAHPEAYREIVDAIEGLGDAPKRPALEALSGLVRDKEVAASRGLATRRSERGTARRPGEPGGHTAQAPGSAVPAGQQADAPAAALLEGSGEALIPESEAGPSPAECIARFLGHGAEDLDPEGEDAPEVARQLREIDGWVRQLQKAGLWRIAETLETARNNLDDVIGVRTRARKVSLAHKTGADLVQVFLEAGR